MTALEVYFLFKLFFFSVLTDVKNKWENSSWGRRLIVQKKRASLNDFDRFKLMLAKIKVGHDVSILCLLHLVFLDSKFKLLIIV